MGDLLKGVVPSVTVTVCSPHHGVVDAVDAMTTDQPYHRASSLKEALVEVHRHSGAQLDPLVVAAFSRVVQEPWRSLGQHVGLGGD